MTCVKVRPEARRGSMDAPETLAPDLLPGSEAAEIAADLLLARAKRCGLRMAHSLRQAAGREGTGSGLRRAADEITLSCAYYTDRQLTRRVRGEARFLVTVPEECLDGSDDAAGKGVEWLSGLVREGLERLAGSLGLSPSQAAVWAEHVRGETQEEIGRRLGMTRTTAWVHLSRAHRRVGESWLAAYRASLRPRGR